MRARAETIVQNARIWAGRGEPPARALAMAGGRILAMGEPGDVDSVRGPETRIVDLAGQTVVPGLVDAHAHIWKIGHLLTGLLDLRRIDGLVPLAERLRDQASRLPAGAWLQGRGYNEARFAEGRAPTRHELDAVVPDRPVVLIRTCAHVVVCNSRALAAAGIAADTPAPPGGEIDREPGGQPSGVLRETAMGLVLSRVPPPTSSELATMIQAALRHQLSRGITSTTDAGVAPDLIEVYRRLDADHRLPSRVNVMALALVDGIGPVPLPAAHHVTDRLRIDTVKFFADGGLSGATAALNGSYRHANTRGVLRLDADELYALARGPHEAGWRIATHAIGDAAIGHVLQAYDRLGPGPVRQRIEHCGLPTTAHLGWAARLRAIVVPQTIFIHALGRNFRRYLPDALLSRVYPVRAMLDAGLAVALSSDAPVVEDDSPLAGMQAALLRRDEDGAAIGADERITAEEALDAYTRGGAVASGDDADRGCLRPGMQADLTVLSGHPLETPAEALTTLKVTQTWVAGTLVHEA